MLELASEIIELTNSNSKLIFEPLPSDDPKHREPDISKARNLLKWEPNVSRNVGLSKTIQYLEKQI
jgi:nucleoside-diphosphate-sugar epimerase